MPVKISKLKIALQEAGLDPNSPGYKDAIAKFVAGSDETRLSIIENIKNEQKIEENIQTSPNEEESPRIKKPTKKEDRQAGSDEILPSKPKPKKPAKEEVIVNEESMELARKMGHSKDPRYTQLLHRIAELQKMSPEQRKKATEQILNEFTIEKKVTSQKEDPKMSEENTNTPKEDFNDAYKKWNEEFQRDHPQAIIDGSRSKAQEYFNQHGSLTGFDFEVVEEPDLEEKLEQEDPQQEETPSDKKEVEETPGKKITIIGEADPTQLAPINSNADSNLEGMKTYWENAYKEDKDHSLKSTLTDGTLKLEITASEEAKKLGDTGAEITYYGTDNVVMPLSDYSYFDKIVKAARDVDGSNTIECGEIKSPAYFNRLIAASYANGLEVDNVPPELDLSKEAVAGIPSSALEMLVDNQIFKRGIRNDGKEFNSSDISYETYVRAFEIKKEIAQSKNEALEFDVSAQKFPDEATRNKQIVAAIEAGFEVKNIGTLDLSEKNISEINDEALGHLVDQAVFAPLKEDQDIPYNKVKEAMSIKKMIADHSNTQASLDKDILFKSDQGMTDEEKTKFNMAKNKYIAAALSQGIKVEGVKFINKNDLNYIDVAEDRAALISLSAEIVKNKKNYNNNNNDNGNSDGDNNNNRRKNNYNNNNRQQTTRGY